MSDFHQSTITTIKVHRNSTVYGQFIQYIMFFRPVQPPSVWPELNCKLLQINFAVFFCPKVQCCLHWIIHLFPLSLGVSCSSWPLDLVPITLNPHITSLSITRYSHILPFLFLSHHLSQVQDNCHRWQLPVLRGPGGAQHVPQHHRQHPGPVLCVPGEWWPCLPIMDSGYQDDISSRNLQRHCHRQISWQSLYQFHFWLKFNKHKTDFQ